MIRFTLRLPEGIYRRLDAIAKRNKRSLHAQILYILERYLAEVAE